MFGKFLRERVAENVWDRESVEFVHVFCAADIVSRVVSLVNFRDEDARVAYVEHIFEANKLLIRRGIPWLNPPRVFLEDYLRAVDRELLPPGETRLTATLAAQEKEFQKGLGL